jgi:hypothetical protein
MTDCNELRERAEAATPGPWRAGVHPVQDDSVVWGPGSEEFLANVDGDQVLGGVAYDVNAANARFIAAANPAAVLHLLRERDELEAKLERVKALPKRWRKETREAYAAQWGPIRETREDFAREVEDVIG